MGSFDIIITGAGISGLILASELSKEFSVLILEKNNDDYQPQKYWVTTKECLDENPHLKDCVDSYYGQMDFISHDEKKFKVFGDYILWDPIKLCEYLKKEIISNGSQIKYAHRFYNYSLTNSRIIVYSNDKKFDAKLLVDCMGYSSPLVYLNNAVNILGYYILYGGILRLKKKIDPIIMGNVLINKNPHFLEIFPKADGSSNVAIIKPVSQVESYEKLKNDFIFITQASHYSDYFESVKEYKELGGIVSVGDIRKTSFDRILFFGEAGQLQPAVTNTCLTKLLLFYKKYSSFIFKQIHKGSLKQGDLSHHPKTMNNFSRKFQLNIYKEMQKWSSIDFSNFIDLLNCFDSKTLNDFIFNEINPSYFLEPKKLFKVLKSGNYIWLKPFLKSIL